MRPFAPKAILKAPPRPHVQRVIRLLCVFSEFPLSYLFQRQVSSVRLVTTLSSLYHSAQLWLWLYKNTCLLTTGWFWTSAISF